MINVFIMAAGDALRCDKKPKQLFMLPDGKTVIGRLIDQIEERGFNPVIVTHREDIAAMHENVFMPINRETLCDSILSTEPVWDYINIFILGDVVFTGHGISEALTNYNTVTVIGNEAEIYGMQFFDLYTNKVKDALKKGASHGLGKLRYFYKAYTGLPMEGPDVEEKHMVWLRDETNDIDSVAEYQNMVARWSMSANNPRH